ncbi:M99 family carboxypeptidase catalytic domain-containing protein [Syntrophomonas erecta]
MTKIEKTRRSTLVFGITMLLLWTAILSNPISTAAASGNSHGQQKVVAAGSQYATELYIIDSGKPGPVVMIVGGVHGDETAGYKTAHKVKNYSIKKGKLLVIPEANKRAVAINKRYVPGEGNLNRHFPKSASRSSATVLSRSIYQVVKDYDVDWLMDLHEGVNYYKNKRSSSVGQTLIYYPANSTRYTVDDIVKELNRNISGSYRKFTLIRHPVKGSLARSTGQFLDVHSFIFETSQKAPLATRIGYQAKAVQTLLKQLNML